MMVYVVVQLKVPGYGVERALLRKWHIYWDISAGGFQDHHLQQCVSTICHPTMKTAPHTECMLRSTQIQNLKSSQKPTYQRSPPNPLRIRSDPQAAHLAPAGTPRHRDQPAQLHPTQTLKVRKPCNQRLTNNSKMRKQKPALPTPVPTQIKQQQQTLPPTLSS